MEIVGDRGRRGRTERVEPEEEEENEEEEESNEGTIGRRRREAAEAQSVFWRLRDIELEMQECRQEREAQEQRRVRLERSKNQLLRGMAYRRSQRGGRGRGRVVDADGPTSTTTAL